MVDANVTILIKVLKAALYEASLPLANAQILPPLLYAPGSSSPALLRTLCTWFSFLDLNLPWKYISPIKKKISITLSRLNPQHQEIAFSANFLESCQSSLSPTTSMLLHSLAIFH